MSTDNSNLGRYAGWSREQLVARLTQLDNQAEHLPVLQPRASKKPFDFSRYPRRKIALKFCYSGWDYSGLAFQLGPTPLPTVENVLFDVLARTHLVDPEAAFDGCGWEKCGRTDRGVSAGGQVVSLWVRSALTSSDREPSSERPAGEESTSKSGLNHLDDEFLSLALSENTSIPPKSSKSAHEHDYVAMLNRLLPDTIRVIAWSPVSDTFSARFSCKYRHYKYFFSSTQLDPSLMQAAAERLLGEHDFQNLCKVDAQKQITSFKRKILRASITPLDADEGGAEGMYVFDLVGTAFLYHQVRHIMAVLFLVGTGLEPISSVSQLMNSEEDAEQPYGDETYIPLNRKPEYQMADALPLMLWECGYDESELDWRINGRPTSVDGSEKAYSNLCHELECIYNRSQVYTVLNRHFLKAARKHHPIPNYQLPLKSGFKDLKTGQGRRGGAETLMNIPLGGGTFKRTHQYIPLLERKRLDTVEVINERYRLGRGQRLKELEEAAGKTTAHELRVNSDDGDE
ncbi:pseudouridine synthase [Pholiota conissans]|uniref:Pseudouridine synthase n=1 Tax=Pholiota conissans TaxID=109636 RepID=A0A9P5YZI1_9AGAR|nr:pseudouridine synthase [Pholiota conissans]